MSVARIHGDDVAVKGSILAGFWFLLAWTLSFCTTPGPDVYSFFGSSRERRRSERMFDEQFCHFWHRLSYLRLHDLEINDHVAKAESNNSFLAEPARTFPTLRRVVCRCGSSSWGAYPISRLLKALQPKHKDCRVWWRADSSGGPT